MKTIAALRFPASLLDAANQWKTTRNIARQRLLAAERDGYLFHIKDMGRKFYSPTETGLAFIILHR